MHRVFFFISPLWLVKPDSINSFEVVRMCLCFSPLLYLLRLRHRCVSRRFVLTFHAILNALLVVVVGGCACRNVDGSPPSLCCHEGMQTHLLACQTTAGGRDQAAACNPLFRAKWRKSFPASNLYADSHNAFLCAFHDTSWKWHPPALLCE